MNFFGGRNLHTHNMYFFVCTHMFFPRCFFSSCTRQTTEPTQSNKHNKHDKFYVEAERVWKDGGKEKLDRGESERTRKGRNEKRDNRKPNTFSKLIHTTYGKRPQNEQTAPFPLPRKLVQSKLTHEDYLKTPKAGLFFWRCISVAAS